MHHVLTDETAGDEGCLCRSAAGNLVKQVSPLNRFNESRDYDTGMALKKLTRDIVEELSRTDDGMWMAFWGQRVTQQYQLEAFLPENGGPDHRYSGVSTLTLMQAAKQLR